MGAWGAGSFQNDDALDFIGELDGVSDLGLLHEIFGAVVSAGHDELDADASAKALAAAEIVAALRGHPSNDQPDEVGSYVERAEDATSELISAAREAVSRVLLDSELLELWSESEESASEWNEVVTGLIGRLQEAPRARGAVGPRDSGKLTAFSCCVCLENIPQNELLELRVTKPSLYDDLFAQKNIYAHERCLNRRLHPQQILQFWDPGAA